MRLQEGAGHITTRRVTLQRLIAQTTSALAAKAATLIPASRTQSGSAALLSEGMELMKTLLQHATQYEVESRRG